jgi:hypothetical protein
LSSTIAQPTFARNKFSMMNYELRQLPSKTVSPPVKFQLLEDSPVIFDMSDVFGEFLHSLNISHLIRRASVTPMQLVAVAGPNLDLLLVGAGHSVFAYALPDFEKVDTLMVAHYTIQIAVCPLDPSLFALVSLHCVDVYSISISGFQKTHEIELLLEAIGSHIFVNSVIWVPNQALVLAVICNTFIKIYDVPADVLSPFICFTPTGSEFFSSAVFKVTGDEASVGLFATSGGKIAIQSLNVDGPVVIDNFLQTSAPIPQIPTISCSEELFFVTAQNSNLLVARLHGYQRCLGAPQSLLQSSCSKSQPGRSSGRMAAAISSSTR